MSLDQEPRTERSHGLKATVRRDEQQALFNLVNTAAWPVLLDVIERCCIQQETRLINCDVADDKAILAEHRMSKAYWQIFVGMQKEVLHHAREFAGTEASVPRTETEQIQSLEGMNYARDVEE